MSKTICFAISIICFLYTIYAGSVFASNLYVANYSGNTITQYDPSTGQYKTIFSSTGLNKPWGMALSPDNNYLYVCNSGSHNVVKYDFNTGQYLGTVINTVVNYPIDLLFGPDGYLYVSNHGGDTVTSFDLSGPTATLKRTFSVSTPAGIAFDSNGFLYVGNHVGRNIVKFNATTGQDYGVVINTQNSGSSYAVVDIAFDSGNTLYVCNGYQVSKYDTSGNYLGKINTSANNLYTGYLDFDDQGNIYVSGYWQTPNKVLVYDTDTCNYLSSINTYGMSETKSVLFYNPLSNPQSTIPEPISAILLLNAIFFFITRKKLRSL